LHHEKFKPASTSSATSPAKRCMGVLCIVYYNIEITSPIQQCMGLFYSRTVW